ncbi:TetR/AcrR family transcriptional regulator [Streptomyces gilvosporeus]|uniref:TetR family transcriptional regulator n=1 Tax=Streptomyces gilvosporeus TaxID=553510 RepID=A0A1V0TYC1_9ACTN|nr:TetR/AcrR family transcriptional regulator [Streptomyces gilvosporeus]ARF57808.1 TetR family transcriptional regulator [Streptomyces gilvosporeus]
MSDESDATKSAKDGKGGQGGQTARPEGTGQRAQGERRSARRPGTRRPGGRTARTRAAVRDAVLAGLSAHGYPGLTVEYVAEHSGVHKTTLYRRWENVEGLIADALDLAGEDSWLPPDTGTLEGDLRALAREVVDAFTDPALTASSSAMVAAGFQSERAAQALRAYYTERFRRCETIVERAAGRGELAPAGDGPADATAATAAVDAGALVRAACAPVFLRLFITREPVDTALADQSAAAAVAAARAGAFATSGTGGAVGMGGRCGSVGDTDAAS